MRFLLVVCLVLQGCATMLAGQMGAGATVVTVAETVDQAKTAGEVDGRQDHSKRAGC